MSKKFFTISSGDIQDRKKSEERHQIVKSALYVGGTVASTLMGSKAFDYFSAAEANRGRNNIGRYSKYFNMSSRVSLDTIKARATAKDVFVDLAMRAEYLSPFHILRTFEMSNVLTPFALADDAEMTISGRSVGIQKERISKLLEAKGKKLTDNAERYGIRVINGDVFELVDRNGTIGEKIYSGARLVNSRSSKIDPITGKEIDISYNKTLKHHSNIIGVNPNFTFESLYRAGEEGWTITDNNNWNWTRAYARARWSTAMDVIEKPADHILEMFTGSIDSKGASKQAAFLRRTLRFTGDHNQSIPRQILSYSTKFAGAATKAAIGYKIAETVIGAIAPDGSAFDQGLLHGVATLAVNARLTYAKVIGDTFKNYRDKQEFIAPDSTSLMTLAGFPLAGAMLGGTLSYGKRLIDTKMYGAERAASMAEATSTLLGDASNKKLQSLIGGKELPQFLQKALPRHELFAKRGALAAMAIVMPFLPGALIGEDSEELKKIYSGQKEVAIKANRWWFSGANRHEGDKTKYYTQHWYARLMSDAKDKSKYGDVDTAKKMNPFFHPFDYLNDPYKFEKMHTKDRPYPVWGMEVSAGNVLGKVFERTVGQVIKKDTINPEITAQQKAYEEFIDKRIASADSSKIDSRINDFREKFMTTKEGRTEVKKTLDIKQQEEQHKSGKLSEEQVKKHITVDRQKAKVRGDIAEVDLSHFNISIDDADTIILKDKSNSDADPIEIRLSGLDAPEISGHKNDPLKDVRYNQEQAYGQEAIATMKRILANNSKLKLLINKGEMTYGRYVGAIIGDDDKNLNLELLAQGGASGLPWGGSDMISGRDIGEAERIARRENTGMWELSRYKAFSMFSRLTGQKQTFNTFTRLDKLAERPELAEVATFLDSFGDTKGELGEGQIARIQELAAQFKQAQQEFKAQNKAIGSFGFIVSEDQAAGGDAGKVADGIQDGVFRTKTAVSSKDKSLIDSGKMLSTENAEYAPNENAVDWSIKAGQDFVGLTGFATRTAAKGFGIESETATNSLARSGEALNPARDFGDLNLGGAFGLTEAQRRLMPTGAEFLRQNINPIKNQMPWWLPGGGDNYYTDFKTGDPYSKLENGDFRLPGKGYEAMHPELQGLDPNDYPDIFKFKILADVAVGSKQYYDFKNIMDERYQTGELTEREVEIYETIKEQEEERSQKKKFSEYRTDEDLDGVGLGWKALNSLWETASHNAELPTDYLTFFRPAGKLIHQRTATEDYAKTQMVGTDMSLWTSPKEHFIKPAVTSTLNILKGAYSNTPYTPDSVEDKRAYDTYFDKLEYIKQRKIYKEAAERGDEYAMNNAHDAYQRTLEGTKASGLNAPVEIMRSFIALPENERPYFASFLNADKDTRSTIRNMVPDDVQELYESLWRRKDAIEASGSDDPEAVIAQVRNAEDEQLQYENADLYNKYKEEAPPRTTFREYLSDINATAYVSEVTGMPDESFEGWDPRIDTKDIKLKTLAMAGEDIHNFGFWESDKERLSRMISLNSETQVITQAEQIKNRKKSEISAKDNMAAMLYNQGYDVLDLQVSSHSSNEFNLSVETT